jgi:hypothetical protein
MLARQALYHMNHSTSSGSRSAKTKESSDHVVKSMCDIGQGLDFILWTALK